MILFLEDIFAQKFTNKTARSRISRHRIPCRVKDLPVFLEKFISPVLVLYSSVFIHLFYKHKERKLIFSHVIYIGQHFPYPLLFDQKIVDKVLG